MSVVSFIRVDGTTEVKITERHETYNHALLIELDGAETCLIECALPYQGDLTDVPELKIGNADPFLGDLEYNSWLPEDAADPVNDYYRHLTGRYFRWNNPQSEPGDTGGIALADVIECRHSESGLHDWQPIEGHDGYERCMNAGCGTERYVGRSA